MRTIVILLLVSFCNLATAQNVWLADTLRPNQPYDNTFSMPVGTDSLTSGYVLWIKKELKPHKHLTHSEHVYVLDGEAEMRLGDKTIKVKNGSIVYIAQGVVHSVKVTSKRPLKVLAIQAPFFDGTDRVFVD